MSSVSSVSGSSVSVLDRLPAFGFGAASLGNLYRTRSDDECGRLLEAAWSQGFRYFDTAPLYGFGLSERRLGAFLQTRSRNEFVISSKAGRVLKANAGPHEQRAYFIDADPFEPHFDYSYDGIMRSYEASLIRLGLDRIDILLMHDIGAATHGDNHSFHFRQALDGGFRAMDELRRSGDVGAIGLGVNEWQICAEAMAETTWDVMLLAGRYTLLEQEALDFLNLCTAVNVRVIAAGVFNSGVLAAKHTERATFNYDVASPEIMARVEALAAICTKHNTPLGAAALQFPYSHPAIISVLAGFGSFDELMQNLEWARMVIPPALWIDLVMAGLMRTDVPLPTQPLLKGAL
ncbi:MAG: aldo/keto reductase [Parvibaculum sp.]|nr:aldo/keto reductase [Parvibaculum sp.]